MECIESINEGMKVFYILPSREAMFHVRKIFTEELGGIFGCHIFGFDDFEKLILGDDFLQARIIGDLEEQFLLQGALKEIPEDNVFDKVKDKPGFLKLLINTIRQLKRSNSSPEEFIEKTVEFQGDIKKKSEGLYAIYTNYEKIKADKGLMDIDDISIRAAAACESSKVFRNGGIIVIDGFINIDPVNVKLIEGIQKGYPNIAIYINVPFKNSNNEQFLINEIIKDFEKLDFERIEEPKFSCSLSNAFFKSISQDIYSGEGNVKVDSENLKISNSPCLDHEIRFAAGQIKDIIQYKEIKPSEIAVITADMESYSSRVFEIFKEYGIPLNAKQKYVLSSIPVIKDIMALWRLGLKEESNNAFISIVTSKYLLPIEVLSGEDFETDMLFKIAVSVLQNGEQGNYLLDFLNGYAEYTDNELANEAMKSYINIVLAFEKTLIEHQLDAVGVFKGFFDVLQIERNISTLYQEGLLDGELWLRDIEVFNELVKFFDRLNEAYEEYRIDKKDIEAEDLIREIFDMLFGLETGDISRDSGGVRLIPPDLARGQNYDTVFILGVNEGIFPATVNSSCIFNNHELEKLYYMGINLGYSDWELEREKIRFNICVSSARNRLFLSYRTADEDGGVMIASPFIDEVREVLDKDCIGKVISKSVSMRDRMNFEREVYSTTEAVKRTSSLLKNKKTYNLDNVCRDVQKKLEYPLHAAIVEFSRELGINFDTYDGKLDNPVLAQIDAGYGFSASQLNSYSRCPFTYFAQRVLGLTVEDESMQEMLDMGTFYHAVLKAYHEGSKNPLKPDVERVIDIFNEMVDDLPLGSIPMQLKGFIMEEILLVLQNFIIHDAENLSRYYETTGCSLKPVMLEEPFKIMIGTENSVLKGIADRVDLEVDSKGAYTGRFILYDYKKGGIKGVKECIEGSDFQLPLYHHAFNSILKENYNIAEPECLALLYYSIEKLEWNGIIRKDIKKALFEGRKGTRSTPDKDNMGVILSWAEKEAETVIKNIRKGHFMPPKECPASAMFGCTYTNMCRYERTRFSKKAGEKA
jgi:ATP-dependent helicase/DNAse subunit B